MRDFFAFRTMISGFVIQIVFVLGLIAIVIASIGAIANDQALVGLLVLVFGTLYWRILCEVFIVIFRMNSSLTAIKANTTPMPSALGGNGGTPDPGGARIQEAAPVATAAEPLSSGRSDEPTAATSVAPATQAVATPPEGWYSDSERPGHKRWWDGTKWGIRDDEHSSTR